MNDISLIGMEQLVKNVFCIGWWIILKYPVSSFVLLLNYMFLLKN